MIPLDSTTAADLATALAAGPEALFRLLSRLLTAVPGIRTATFIAVTPDRTVTHRIGTSDPAHFPVGNVDPVGDNPPWDRAMLDEKRPVIGNDVPGMATFLPETGGLVAMGYGACACFPIVIAGETRGVVALLGGAGIFTPAALADIAALLPLAALIFTFPGISDR
jgi:GAF domain-containing protein